MSQIVITAVLQALVQQQTALLQAHAESLRLQRVLVEHLLGSTGKAPSPVDGNGAPDPQSLLRVLQPAAPAVPITMPAPDQTSGSPAAGCSAPAAGPDQAQQAMAGPPAEPIADGPDVAGPASPAAASPPAQQPSSRPPGGGGGRASKYFQAHPARPARVVTSRKLAVLRGVAEMGDAGRLILQFGPYRGATLGQVAQVDPEYLRELSLKAQRPEVRAAALKLANALEALEREQTRTTRRSSRFRPRADREQGGGL